MNKWRKGEMDENRDRVRDGRMGGRRKGEWREEVGGVEGRTVRGRKRIKRRTKGGSQRDQYHPPTQSPHKGREIGWVGGEKGGSCGERGYNSPSL